jgi:hypothetical protein
MHSTSNDMLIVLQILFFFNERSIYKRPGNLTQVLAEGDASAWPLGRNIYKKQNKTQSLDYI